MSVRGCFRIEANGYGVALRKELEQKHLESSRESYHVGRLSLACHARQVASEVSARRIVLLLLQQPGEPLPQVLIVCAFWLSSAGCMVD